MILWSLLAAFPVVTAAIAVRVARRRFVVVQVVGSSMVPALSPGDRVLVRRQAGEQVRAGAVVVLPEPHDECRPGKALAPGLPGTPWVIKRVAAAPGDTVPESVRRAVRGAAVVPPGMLVVLGDNRAGIDSRTWGFVSASGMLGAVVRRVSRSSVPT